MSELKKQVCPQPTWHGPHTWWWSDSGGGHMLSGEPDETDFETEKGLVEYRCPGNPEEIQSGHHEEPLSEQTFEAYEKGVKVGNRQMLEKVVGILRAQPDSSPGSPGPLTDLMQELGVE